MKNYGSIIQNKAQELLDAHKANGLSDEQAKDAALITLKFMFTKAFSFRDTPEKSQWQKVYNHLTGTPCPYR